MKFSQRIGKTSIRDMIQVDGMDYDLRVGIWNVIYDHFLRNIEDTYVNFSSIPLLWIDFFKMPLDYIYTNNTTQFRFFRKWFKDWYDAAEWFEIYDLLEYISSFEYKQNFDIMIESTNSILEKEMSAYRILKGSVTKITDELELSAIENASATEWNTVNEHVKTAVQFLSNRKSPDYRNSIKETISALESACELFSENTNGKFGTSIAKVTSQLNLHSSLKKGFNALYGYSSDEGGIRHSLKEDSAAPTFEDAKYMLVTCSAFINYLKSNRLE